MEGNLTRKYKTATEYFHEAFPEYIAAGMTYREFWELDSSLVKDYRNAMIIKQKEINYVAWLNGLYMLNALNSGVPVCVTGFAKSKIELPHFPDRPIDFEAQTAEAKAKEERKKAIDRMKQIAEQFNKTFRKKKDGPGNKGKE